MERIIAAHKNGWQQDQQASAARFAKSQINTNDRRTNVIRMICRNKVEDFAKWKSVFDSHSDAHRQAGLSLEHLWRGLEDANEVFFIFAVADFDRARAFISAPDSKEAGQRSGVRDGNYWFVE
jgi:hypothetical protein